MRKLILIIILSVFCFGFTIQDAHKACIARMNASVGGYSCANCSLNDATFIWECNSLTVGNTGYSPCGCSDGDSIVAEYDEATISSGLCSYDDAGSDLGDYHEVNISGVSEDLIQGAAGTIFIKVRINSTWYDNLVIFSVFADGGADKIDIYLTTSNDIKAGYTGNTEYDSVNTAGNHMVVDTWYIIRYRWDISASVADHQITVFDLYMNPVDTSTAQDTISGADFTGGVITPGYYYDSVTDYDFDIDYVHIYSTWKDTDPNVGCDDCSGALEFSWHMEDNDSTPDVTVGDPCGCADDDEIGDEYGSPTFSSTQKSDGTYALYIDAADEFYYFYNDININDIKLTFDIYIVSYPTPDYIIFIKIKDEVDGDFVNMALAGSVLIAARGLDDSATEEYNLEVTVATGSWVSCEYQAKTGIAGNDHYLICGANSDESDDDLGTAITSTIQLIGETEGADVGVYYLDNIKISSSDRY